MSVVNCSKSSSDCSGRLAHGDEFLGRRRVDTDGGVELGLGGIAFERDAETLDDLAGVGAHHMAADHAVGRRIDDPVTKSGITDARIAIRGSAVTGRKFNKATGKYDGPEFDKGRTSDYDIAIVSPSLLKMAREKGFRLPTNVRTTELSESQLKRLGLSDLIKELPVGNRQRELTYMIYVSQAALDRRGAWIPLD